jgi:hypothetical protein
VRPAYVVAGIAALWLGYAFFFGLLASIPWAVGTTVLLGAALLVGTVALPLVWLARIVARARLRATGADALAHLRGWVSAKPRAVRALLAAPSLLGVGASLLGTNAMFWLACQQRGLLQTLVWVLGLWVLPGAGLWLVGRASLRGLLAPLADEAGGAAEGADGFLFSAVAVTPETRAAVGALSLVSVAAVALFAAVPVTVLTGPGALAAIVAYVAAAAAATAAFQRASRVALGFDGVLVTGSSRTRFFAYRDLDEVETARGGDIVLRRHGRVALRLQLHGEDAARSGAILERLRDAIARAKDPGGGGAHALADAASAVLLARAARGDADYRTAGATREEIWELVEAASTGGTTRAAAAAALAPELDGDGRARLRVAAQRCAEPAVRRTLLRIAGGDEAEGEEEEPLAEPSRARVLR